MRLHHLGLAALVGAAALTTAERSAQACGGCFAPIPTGTEIPPVVTSHRMALSISTDQTVLWDQIRYSGAPSEFAWVLPVKPGAKIEVASDAFFDVLDAATNPVVIPPTLDCDSGSCSVARAESGSMGCGDSNSADGDGGLQDTENVDIVSHSSAGPYEIVVLRSEEPGALQAWLELHEYAVQDDIAPVIDTYVAEGFDFVALRLVPSAGVQQMRPVRVVQQGAVPTLPLRMVAAGSGARTAISLFVIAEARYTTANFYEGAIPEERLEYDFATGLSNYAALRDELFEANGQQTFLATYAQKGALFRQTNNPTTSTPVVYRTTAGSGYIKMADAYIEQGFANSETSSTACAAAFDGLDKDWRRVVNPCDEEGNCRDVEPTAEIDARTLACDAPIGSDFALDDLAVALTGMHPADVWVTRLDANLGRDALQADLDLKAHGTQSKRPGFITPTLAASTTCEIAGAAAATGQGRTPRERARLGMGVGLLAVLLGAMARRLLRLARVARARNPELGSVNATRAVKPQAEVAA